MTRVGELCGQHIIRGRVYELRCSYSMANQEHFDWYLVRRLTLSERILWRLFRKVPRA